MEEQMVSPEHGITSSLVPLKQLKAHPRNYQSHPTDEIEHIMESIRANGVYRNVVVASDGVTILAGHGVVEAARRLNLERIPTYRVPFDPDDPRAIKLLVGDNKISHLAEVDDRALTDLLREIKASDVDLLGTGYDEMMLANLLFVTRPASEIADLNAAAQWVGLPEYDTEYQAEKLTMIVNFASEEDRQLFCRRLGLDASTIPTTGKGKSIWWPEHVKDDVRAVRFTSSGSGDEEEEEEEEEGDTDA